ncbi:hypothetical protein M569_09616 [Genlisea aurea]|uniref:Uncharacterized protein n=1 Tax=Genlisea aurea TaxID=192259 RepID=S8CDW2_9LAMI|nr:hypothetical protein M569_09616 [Genlisea aurea]
MLFGLRFNSIIAKLQQPLHCFQNFGFRRDSSAMDARKGKKNVVRLWRAVSTQTQPNFHEDDKREAVRDPVVADIHEMEGCKDEDSKPTEKHSLSMKEQGSRYTLYL